MTRRALLSLILLLMTAPALAAPPHAAPVSLAPRNIVFSASEYGAYESAHRRQRNRWIIAVGSSTLGTLLAAGVTLLAFGLSDKGNASYTTLGVTSLCLATLGGFTALDLFEW